MSVSPTQLIQYAVYIALLIIVGLAEYVHLVAPGTLQALLLLIVGHFFGAVATPTLEALSQNTAATQQNTVATVATTQPAIVPPGSVQLTMDKTSTTTAPTLTQTGVSAPTTPSRG